jgi:phosphotriesterase-related protein
VLGPVAAGEIGLTDAHTHLWIEPVEGAAEGSPTLTEYAAILAELREFHTLGGCALIDCQPGGCGRDGRRLAQLSRESGLHVVASTGFHRARYYPRGFWLWDASADQAAEHFLCEIREGLAETRGLEAPAHAGVIKVACEASLAGTPRAALEGAAAAAVESGSALEVHTERGAGAEDILAFFARQGVQAEQVVLCHMDKRPDAGLHRELAAAGALLEYDTFYRPKYEPEKNAWPLIAAMLEAGYDRQVALATDIAEKALWKHIGGGAGLPGLVMAILPRLEAAGASDTQVKLLLGRNIVQRLARPVGT